MPIAQANNIDIWYETFGNKDNPTLLLIMGGCCQGICWPTEFCEKLSYAGFYVIRYDHRDTGLSTCFDYEKNSYTLMDMMRDAVGLLDYLNIKKSHLIGLSMGGPIAELIAVHHLDRILSMTLIATSCDFRPMNLAYLGQPVNEHLLPPPKDIYLNWMQKFMITPPKNENEHIELRVEGWKILNGDKVPFDEILCRKIQKLFIERLKHPESIINHIYACRVSEDLVKNTPQQVKVPTLIMHGTEDPILPPEHGQALASKIPYAKYIPIEGMGHVTYSYFDALIIKNIQCLAK